ncbi:hypothetical protein [Nonomuraea sp. JJY05]|uniref:hypothetical protein n=1 Tax=Nonomuraea sp. JJY05 TaxID=3350255 RepID=UPI00373E2D5A
MAREDSLPEFLRKWGNELQTKRAKLESAVAADEFKDIFTNTREAIAKVRSTRTKLKTRLEKEKQNRALEGNTLKYAKQVISDHIPALDTKLNRLDIFLNGIKTHGQADVAAISLVSDEISERLAAIMSSIDGLHATVDDLRVALAHRQQSAATERREGVHAQIWQRRRSSA